MKRFLQLAIVCLLMAVSSHAQQTQTKVTGTIVDPNSVPYYPATVLACLTPPTTNPTVAGAAINTNAGAPYCVGPAQTGTDGTFQIPLYANSVIQCNNVACSTQWQFTVTATGTAPPAGKGAQNFQVVTTITNLTAQDVGGTLSAAAPVLLNSGGGGGSVGPGTPTNVGCFSTTSNLGNCADPITDVGGVVTIPADLIIGRGGGAASFGLPLGPVSGCQIPLAGYNNLCSVTDGFYESLNGADYVPFGSGNNSSSQVFNVLDYGAVGDGYHIAADTAGIEAAFTASAPTCGVVYFPGNHSYGFDTIAATYTVTNFCGTIQGDGYTSTVTVNNDIHSMWTFIFPHDLTIKNMHFQQTPAGFNNGAFPVSIDTGTNLLISHNYTNDGDTAWRIGNSTHVRYESNSVSNQHGNGLFGPNVNDFHSVNNSCFNNGDTCEEYSRWHFETSPTCQWITSTGMTSTNDGTGIIVDSCTDVAISDFTIYTPGGGGQGAIFISQDQLTTNDHYPNRVQVSNGMVYGAGYSNGNINNSNSTPCINIHTVDNIAEPFNVLLSNLHLEHCAGSAIFVSDLFFNINLMTDNIRIIDAGAGGTSVGDPKNIAFNFIGGKSLKATNTYIENAYGSSFQSVSGGANTYVELTNTTSINPNQRGTGSFVNAIHNRNTSGTFLLNGLSITDTWATTSRSGVVSAASTGIQTAQNITFNCTAACANPSFTNLTIPITYGADMSGTQSGDGFRVPNVAAGTTTKNGSQVYDTTNKNIHVGANAVDNIVAMIPSASPPTNGDLATWSVVGGVVRVVDGGSPGVSTTTGCTTGCNYVLTQGDSIIVGENQSNVMTAINTPQLIQFYNTISRKLGSAVVRVQTASAGGNFDIGVYSVSGTTGTLIWHTGSKSTTSVANLPVTPTPVTLTAGTTYFTAWCADNTTAQIGAVNPSTTVGGMAIVGTAHTWGTNATDLCTAGVLPSTITTTNITNVNTASVPYIYVTN